jgi:hypothetical protein
MTPLINNQTTLVRVVAYDTRDGNKQKRWKTPLPFSVSSFEYKMKTKNGKARHENEKSSWNTKNFTK